MGVHSPSAMHNIHCIGRHGCLVPLRVWLFVLFLESSLPSAECLIFGLIGFLEVGRYGEPAAALAFLPFSPFLCACNPVPSLPSFPPIRAALASPIPVSPALALAVPSRARCNCPCCSVACVSATLALSAPAFVNVRPGQCIFAFFTLSL